MHAIILTLAVVGLSAGNDTKAPEEFTPRTIRLIDLNGDGLLDRLQLGADGALSVALNRGGRQFEEIAQALPAIGVSDLLVDDLNGDGQPDLYLVSPQANAALIGDGTGRFVEFTAELGLADEGVGIGVERVDIDADGLGDVLLHNSQGDVIFWGTEAGAFERDPSTPPVEVDPTIPTRVVLSPNAAPDGPSSPAGGSGLPTRGDTGDRPGKSGLAPGSGKVPAPADASGDGGTRTPVSVPDGRTSDRPPDLRADDQGCDHA